jgi:O-antigen ligase
MLSFSGDQAGADTGALESSAARQRLLEDSIKCTLDHPLLGVGLEQFPNYERAAPGEARWKDSHNSYTQISSECGLPALLFYLAALIWTFRLLARIKQRASGPAKTEMITATYVIGIGVVAYSVAIFFLNFGYAPQFLLVSGLIETMWRVVRRGMQAAQVASEAQSLEAGNASAATAR